MANRARIQRLSRRDSRQRNPWRKRPTGYYRRVLLEDTKISTDGVNDVGDISFSEDYPLDMADKKNIVDPVSFDEEYPLNQEDKQNIVGDINFDEDYPLDLADKKNVFNPVTFDEDYPLDMADKKNIVDPVTFNEVGGAIIFDLKNVSPKIREFIEFNKTYTNKDLTFDLKNRLNKENSDRIDKFLDINYPDAFVTFKFENKDTEDEKTVVTAEYENYETINIDFEQSALDSLNELCGDGNLERLIALILEDSIEKEKAFDS